MGEERGLKGDGNQGLQPNNDYANLKHGGNSFKGPVTAGIRDCLTDVMVA